MPALTRYYAHTLPGIEPIAWLEIKRRLPQARFGEFLFVKEKNGIVTFDYPGAAADLLALRTVEDIFLLALSEERLSHDWGDLRRVKRWLEEEPGFRAAAQAFQHISPAGRRLTYRVVSRLEGSHQYRRKDFEDAVVKGVEGRCGADWRLVDEDADLEIWANIIGSRLLVGLRLSDRSMRHRDYKQVHLPGSLRPSAAAALVELVGIGADDIFLDPLCGGGTILAERALAGPGRALLGGDLVLKHAWAARQNLPSAGAALVCGLDATRLPLASCSITRAATNLPFGKKIGTPQEVEKLYPRVFAELERVLQPGGKLAVLSSQYELIKAVLRQRPGLRQVRGYAVAVLGEWGRMYLIERI